MKKIILFAIAACASTLTMAETRVTQFPLEKVAIYPQVSVPASAVSLNDAKISAEVRANVKTIPVLVGETAKKNEVLVELDNSDYILNLRRANVALEGVKSRLELAEYQLKQAKALFKDKAITDELLRQREAEVTTLKAELEAQQVAVDIAKQDLEKCFIRAPYNAVVVERLAQEGEMANPGTPLVRIVDISHIEVSAKIQPQDVKSLQQAGQFEFKTLQNTYNLRLRKLAPVIDPIQRNREARFTFVKDMALAGSSGSLIWKQTTPHVPANLIIKRGDEMGVFINEDNTAKFVAIDNVGEGHPGALSLPLNTNIIINGRFSLQDGEAITTEIKILN